MSLRHQQMIEIRISQEPGPGTTIKHSSASPIPSCSNKENTCEHDPHLARYSVLWPSARTWRTAMEHTYRLLIFVPRAVSQSAIRSSGLFVSDRTRLQYFSQRLLTILLGWPNNQCKHTLLAPVQAQRNRQQLTESLDIIGSLKATLPKGLTLPRFYQSVFVRILLAPTQRITS